MPPSTKLLNRRPTPAETKAVLNALAAIATVVAATVSGPVGQVAGYVAVALGFATNVRRPGDQPAH